MNHFVMSFQVVFPLFFYMLVGYGIHRAGLLEESVFVKLNQVVFRLFIPASLFMQIYHSDLTHSINPPLFLLVFLLVGGIYAALYAGVPRVVKDKRDAVVLIQGIYRSNFVLFGFVVASNLCEGQDIGVVAALAALVVPYYNILAVILFETMRGGQLQIRHICKEIIKNPLVIAGVGGIGFALLGIPIPELLDESLTEMGNMATPIALICLGGMLSFRSIRKHSRPLAAAALGRLLIIPAVTISIGALMGYRNVELVALLALFASPTAVASSPMAYAMGANGELAGEIVAVTSAVSIVSLFFLIYMMKTLGWIS